MLEQTVQTSKTLERDRFVHLLLTAWTLVLQQEPTSRPSSGMFTRKEPVKPRGTEQAG